MPDPISWAFVWPYFATAFALAYLLGSIPFALVLTRLAGYGDLRTIGSGNIGTTNVLRTGNKPLAALVLILDSGKGAVAVLIAMQFGPDIAVTAAFASVLGHLFPVWLRFKGGKGVATSLGVLLAIAWPVGLAACATWLAMALVFRISSLSAITAFALSPLYAYFLADLQRTELAIAIGVVVILRHHENIRRLVKGQEPRISILDKAKTKQE